MQSLAALCPPTVRVIRIQESNPMQTRYVLTPQQVAVLRALGRGVVELSSAEIAPELQRMRVMCPGKVVELLEGVFSAIEWQRSCLTDAEIR